MNKFIISTNLTEDGVLKIYHGDKLLCSVGEWYEDDGFEIEMMED